MRDIDQFQRVAVHAKHLFMHACSHAISAQPVQRIIALHDMHNSVEWLLGGLWHYYYESEEKPWTMMRMLDQISKEKQKLILRHEISMLNDARNQAQHHAIAPSTDALESYMRYCDAFFRQTLRDLSAECEYDTLFLGLLLPSDLDFSIVSDCFPQVLAEWLGARIERIDPIPDYDSGDPWSRLDLNLRSMMLQAERYLDAPNTVNDDQERDVAKMIMNVLASCLIYGKELAARGLREPDRQCAVWLDAELPTHDDRLHVVDPGAEGYALSLPFEDLTGLSISGNLRMVAGRVDPFLAKLEALSTREDLRDSKAHARSDAAVPILEALLLGFDEKKARRFEKLYYQANARSAPVIGNAELIWCHDFALELMLDLATLIQDVPPKSREILVSLMV